ncbi:MAG: hypothetical protein HYW50_02730 [Candidatus Diapherotrites archaeon]|nr:hypothetical protein [Candidatus Diapherotrites archaeon]
MGIYKKGIDFDPKQVFDPSSKLSLALAIIVAIVLFAVLFSIFLNRDAVSFSFSKNPITVSEQSVLNVTIANTTGKTAREVVVEVFAEDKRSIQVSPLLQKIDILDDFRELEFLINPVQNALPGNYVLNIRTEINGKAFSKQAVLAVKKIS